VGREWRRKGMMEGKDLGMSSKKRQFRVGRQREVEFMV
jgi:hypothetical protein